MRQPLLHDPRLIMEMTVQLAERQKKMHTKYTKACILHITITFNVYFGFEHNFCSFCRGPFPKYLDKTCRSAS